MDNTIHITGLTKTTGFLAKTGLPPHSLRIYLSFRDSAEVHVEVHVLKVQNKKIIKNEKLYCLHSLQFGPCNPAVRIVRVMVVGI